jgi:hypothetical protein
MKVWSTNKSEMSLTERSGVGAVENRRASAEQSRLSHSEFFTIGSGCFLTCSFSETMKEDEFIAFVVAHQ